MKTNNVSPGKSKLGREIAVVIACKLLFIFGLWYFFFSPEHRPEVKCRSLSETSCWALRTHLPKPIQPNNIWSPQ